MALCFMIMPYGRKATQVEPSSNAPGEIDFNALWDKAFAPTIQSLGYDPVRADQDTGALIITQMVERLYFADLVLADMTIPNGNVYYEVGVRHAAKRTGCVLLAADWSKQLFDVAQMRTIRYPLKEGNVEEPTAKAVSEAIKGPIDALSRGDSPVFSSIKGYPSNPDPAAASTMMDVMAQTAVLQGKIRAARAFPKSDRMVAAQALAEQSINARTTPTDAIALIRLVRDCVDTKQDWAWLADFIKRLPSDIADIQEVRETYAFALANSGNIADAIAKLEELLALSGPTPERLGLLGGRYKRLFADAKEEDKAELLDSAIDAYQRGMELDLNQYYCSSNLPRLYRQRKLNDDGVRADIVAKVVLAACERAEKLGLADEWLKQTLLGASFDARECEKAEKLAAEVRSKPGERWKLTSTICDLELSTNQAEDKNTKDRLTAILEPLKAAIG
jgi:tetratricopeptide (TPR) repeat protein